MRITTGMIATQYGRNLNKSLGQLNYFHNRSTTFRRFSSASEDPVGAATAYSLRRSYSQNENYLTNVKDTENLFQTAHSTKLNISTILEEIGSSDLLQGVNGTMGLEDRTIVATKIARLQETLLANANAKYGDMYMFNGGDYTTQPFTIDKSGNLLYRGINVDTGKHVGNTATADEIHADGALIDFGSINSGMLKDYEIEFSANAVGTNSVSSADKKIIIGTGGVAMSTADLQTQLQSLNPADLPAGFDLSAIAVTGSGVVAGAANAKVIAGSPATNKYAEAYIGGTIVNFGSTNGDLLNGYTINVSEGIAGNATVDNNKKVINLFLPAGSSRQDLQDELQALNPASLPPGVNPSKITVSGEKTTTINFASSEITGGEPSIAPGTQFDLDELCKETRYIDLGLGVNFDANNKLDTQSVFDVSMTGLAMLGYGVDDNGDPKNVYSLLTKIVSDLKSPDFSLEATQPFINKFNDQRDALLYNITDTDSKTTFINFTTQRLKDTQINLNEKMISVENVEPSEAIMDFKMQEYAYMAALQMGTKIIMPTFLDFMK